MNISKEIEKAKYTIHKFMCVDVNGETLKHFEAEVKKHGIGSTQYHIDWGWLGDVIEALTAKGIGMKAAVYYSEYIIIFSNSKLTVEYRDENLLFTVFMAAYYTILELEEIKLK